MGIIFNNYPIKGIDVSQYNGTVEWDKVKLKRCDFSGIRVGYGRVTDTEFINNWKNARGNSYRVPYWYLDYYSNHTPTSSANGISDVEWGAIQARTCWNLIKSEKDFCSIVFLDIESASTSVAPKITEVTSRAQTIARSFLETLDTLSGKFNGIYASLGLLSWFGIWFRNRPLWVAWYNEMTTINGVLTVRPIESVRYNVTLTGWTGETLIWQYASDGDATDDGYPDGLDFGMDYKFLDLNIWVQSAEKYATFTNGSTVVIPTPPPTDVPLYSIKIIVANLNVRSSPEIKSTNILRTIGYITVPVYEEKNGFGRIAIDKQEWVSVAPAYSVKILVSIPNPPPSITNWKVIAILGLNIRSGTSILAPTIGSLKYNEEFKVENINGTWGKLYGRDGYVSLLYAKKI